MDTTMPSSSSSSSSSLPITTITTTMPTNNATPVNPPSSQPLLRDLDSLGVNVTRLPATVTNLVDCVAHEIQVIEKELEDCCCCFDTRNNNNNNNNNNKNCSTLEIIMESLEDAIDDGFMCVDLKVLERKLRVWHELFSPRFDSGNSNSNNNYTVTPFFAVKCNPDPLVVEWLARTSLEHNLPLGFDCASIAELELAKKHIQKYRLMSVNGNASSGTKQQQVPTTRIVYANPQRAEADLIQAMELFATRSTTTSSDAETNTTTTTTTSSVADLWLTLDGIEEIYKIAIAKERFAAKAWLGIDNAKHQDCFEDLVPDGHSQVPLGEKFGMRLDQIDTLVKACLEQQIHSRDIIGVSFHCGSGCESVETYLEALEMGKKALQAMDQKLLLLAAAGSSSEAIHRCWLMDIGGGFPGLDGLYGDEGRFAEKAISTTNAAREKKTDDNSQATTTTTTTTTVADIAVAVQNVLQSFSSGDPPLTLIAEPGRYFVEAAFALASRIYQKQVIDGIRVYRIPHGVQGVFKDVVLCGESFVPQPLQTCPKSKDDSMTTLYESKILGPSGDDSEDVVCASCWLPELAVGDWLVFDRMGAYTLSIASRAGRPVMRYVMGGGSNEAIEID
eukprot:CAMPEP_0116127650 /NCGR_PEP_ID=MMETSP0329-20121206/6949_1 /TAXON_ID=697910 /ORGANISM="Pseudo-nitzschia arenysensis, Strain B593" /LENGTH=616 /DNA_ID=CAMNT_0003621755 /DNA_START=124 /DNA_END=1975 /DNA_ORIENTATION=+